MPFSGWILNECLREPKGLHSLALALEHNTDFLSWTRKYGPTAEVISPNRAAGFNVINQCIDGGRIRYNGFDNHLALLQSLWRGNSKSIRILNLGKCGSGSDGLTTPQHGVAPRQMGA